MSNANTPHRTQRKQIVRSMLLVALMVFLTGLYQGMGWLVYSLLHQEGGCLTPECARASEYAIWTAQHAGFARTILFLVMVLRIGQNNLSRADYRLLVVASGLTVVADYFLVYQRENFMAGLGVFVGVHLLYTLRHARGFAESLQPARRARTWRLLLLSAAGVLLLSAAALWWIHAKTRELSLTPPGAPVVLYLAVLSLSLWMAWGTLIRQGFTRFHARLIAVGMTSFYLCDLCVGMSSLLNGLETKPGSFFDNCVGFFYSPALVLLAMSGYRTPPSPPAVVKLRLNETQAAPLSLNPGV